MSGDMVTSWQRDRNESHTEATPQDVTNRTAGTNHGGGDVQDEGGRCTHGLLACRRCYTAPPGVNRFYPPPRGPRAQLHEMGRWMTVLPNRADRRRAGLRGPKPA